MKYFKIIKIIIFLTIGVIFLQSKLYSQDENLTLKKIIENKSNFIGKTLTLNLKLKYLNKDFETISFYDQENYDIVFDIKNYHKNKKLFPRFRNILLGAKYKVNFRIKDIGSDGIIFADLFDFYPVYLDVL